MDHFLLILLALPVIGAIVCAIGPAKMAKHVALLVSSLCFVLTLPLLFGFDYKAGGVPDVETYGAVDAIGFKLSLGVDSISLWLLALTTFLQPLAIAASFASIQEREKEYYAWMLALLTAMLGVFVARDALLFYIFFELTLIPMFFIIGIWGGPQRRQAAGKFFLFTFAGSVFTLAAVIYLGVKADTFDLNAIIATAQQLTLKERFWLVLGFLVGFAVKVPLFPVHTWLPLAHTEAPTAGSVILAGVLLKLGTYGIFRFVLPIGLIGIAHNQPIYSFNLIYGLEFTRVTISILWLIQWLGILCVVGIIYGALVAWVQQDIKKLVAYSSVSHLGFCVLGLAALNHEGIQGSVLYMINHGISTGALFLVVGMIYDRFHTRDINELSGLARRMPVLAFFFILFTLSSVGLPGLNGFASEFLTILGAFRSDAFGVNKGGMNYGVYYGAFAATGIILGAVYMLHMAARVIWGPLKYPGGATGGRTQGSPLHDGGGHATHTEPANRTHDEHHGSRLPADINAREIGILIPLALTVVVLGVIPGRFLDSISAPVTSMIGKPVAPNEPPSSVPFGPAGPPLATGN